MPLDTFDLIVSAILLMAVAIAGGWLIAVGKRHDRLRRRGSVQSHSEYFRGGGLIRALVARRNRRARITDDRKGRRD